MAFAPLILKGNLKINDTDVSEQVTAFKFMGVRAEVEIPATFGTRQSVAGGNDTYQAQVDYLSDLDAEALTQIFWEALADDTGTVELSGTFRAGPISATNPEWIGTALVTGSGVGGDVNTVAVDSQTFPLLDRPTVNIIP